jgi:NAD-dependent dihydropyrimidine dehydrogenase PreA subunit
MAWMVRQPRILYRFYGAMALQEAGNPRGIPGVRPDAVRQCFDAAQCQPTIEWRRRRPAMFLRDPRSLEEIVILPPDRYAAHYIAVSSQVFRGGMDDRADAVLQRTLQHRRRGGLEGVSVQIAGVLGRTVARTRPEPNISASAPASKPARHRSSVSQMGLLSRESVHGTLPGEVTYAAACLHPLRDGRLPIFTAYYLQHSVKAGWQRNCCLRGMAYVITDTCTKDELCVQACPVDCIHPKQDEGGFAEASQLFVNPSDCIDCGACVPVCPTNSIYTLDELPADLSKFAELNAAHFN